MFTFYLIFLLFLNLYLFINGKYVCVKNTTVYLEFNEIAFYETPDFPSLITLEEIQACQITFALKEQNQMDSRIVFAYSENGYETIDKCYFGFGHSSNYLDAIFNGNFLFPPQYFDGSDFYSYQGFVVIDDGSDNCPMESLCSPFKFKNDTEIIYLQSDIIKLYTSFDSCEWNFIAPNGYGFKINVFSFDPLTTKILVSNKTDIIVNHRSLRLNYPYYNDANSIKVYLSAVNKIITGFHASISIVKKHPKYFDGNCIITNVTNNTLVWTNIYSPYKGLQNNIQCFYNLTIPQNVSIAVKADNLVLEKNVDILQYYRSENDIVKITDSGYSYMLETNFEGIEKSVMFEFKSDGSFSSLGFTLEFTFLECKCNSIIYCNASLQSQTISGSDERFCGNLRCKLTIQPCSTGFGFLKFQVRKLKADKIIFNIFEVISNEETILKVDNSNQESNVFYVYLNSANANFLKADTFPSLEAGYFSATYRPFNLSTSNFHVFLTSNVSYYIFDLSLHTIPIVEISKILYSKNLSFFIYSFNTYNVGFTIFNNQSLTYNLNGGSNCFEAPHSYKCEIKRNQIALFQGEQHYAQFAAVRLSDPLDGCIFSETVFTTHGQKIVNITAFASYKGICDIIVLNDPSFSYLITFLWTTASTENVKMFIGRNKKRLYFQFNSISSKKWQYIGLFSCSYIIEIPKNAALFIKLTSIFAFNPYPSLEYPYQSLITTNDFGTSKTHANNFGALYYYMGNVTLRFTALHYNMENQNSFYFQTSDLASENVTIVYINKSGDSVTFHDPVVALYYTSDLVTDEAMFLIETINNTVN